MGLFRRLGSFAEKIWSVIIGRVQPIQEMAQVADLAGIAVSPSELTADFRHAMRGDLLADAIADVAPDEYIPLPLYQESRIPWGRPFAYQVLLEGSDVDTGEWVHTERWLTFSEEVMPGEVLGIAEEYFGTEGEYPQVAIESMSVVKAELRPDEW